MKTPNTTPSAAGATQSAKHTPAPWSADKWPTGWTVSAPNRRYSVCHLEYCINAEPNAQLIAAAPAMLAACKAARAALMAFSGADGSKVAAQLDAVIAAAEGRAE